VQRKRRPDGVAAELLQPLAVVLVDPDAGMEREAVEVGRSPGVLERVGEAEPPVHLAGLQRGEGVLLGAGAVVALLQQAGAGHLADDGGEDPLDILVGRRLQGDEAGRALLGEIEHPVRHDGVEVDVQVDGAPEPLDRGDAGGPRIVRSESPRLPPLPGEDGAGEEVEEAGSYPGIAGSLEPEPARERQDPLAHGHPREDVADEVVGGVLHAPGVAARAAARLAAEGDQPLETAVGTADSYARPYPKSRRQRVVAIPEEFVPFLEHALQATRGPWLFPDEDGKMRTQTWQPEDVLRRALKRAGLVTGYTHACRRKTCRYREDREDAEIRPCPRCGMKLWPKGNVREIRFHDLRHTYASVLLMLGARLVSVQKLLGHSDPKITERRYGHLLPDFMKSEVDRLRFGLDRLAPRGGGELHPGSANFGGDGRNSQEFAAVSSEFGIPLVSAQPPRETKAGTPPVSREVPASLLAGCRGLECGGSDLGRARSRRVERDRVESGGSEAVGELPTDVEGGRARLRCSSVAASLERALQALDAGRVDIARAVLQDLLTKEVEP
jgi:hypothetical protein